MTNYVYIKTPCATENQKKSNNQCYGSAEFVVELCFTGIDTGSKAVLKNFAAGTLLGDTNLDFQMEQYIYRRKSGGICIINLKRIWERLLLAACAIAAIENPADVIVTSFGNTGP